MVERAPNFNNSGRPNLVAILSTTSLRVIASPDAILTGPCMSELSKATKAEATSVTYIKSLTCSPLEHRAVSPRKID